MKKYKNIIVCRCCKSNNLKEVLNLKEQPLANSYHLGDSLEKYPLTLNVCLDCFHSQISVVVDPDEMFKNYLYRSGTSRTMNIFFEWFVEYVEKNVKKGNVLDIACNDGTQLGKFKQKGWKAYGVDPARNLHEMSSKLADNVLCSYFDDNSVNFFRNIKFNAITAQNVFAHTDDVDGFLQNCKKLMDEETKLFIQTSQANMIEEGQFDTIYHEHLSFFSAMSMKVLCQRNGLFLNDIAFADVHGGSYIFIISKSKMETKNVFDVLKNEESRGRYRIETYIEYANKVNKTIEKFDNTIAEYMKKGFLIIGYGAAAKGNTFLNASSSKLHFIIDDNELKHNKLTPGSDTVIVDKGFIKNLSNNTLFIPLSWNYFEEIKSNIKNELKLLKFQKKFEYQILKYYPEFKLERI